MRVLIACEFSGRVRDAFAVRGHDAWSCDLLPTEVVGNHLQCDVREVLHHEWDLMIAHPPCTYLAVSGARWWRGREHLQKQAFDFVCELLFAPIDKIAIENPRGALSRLLYEPDQVIQPYWFGEPESKATCLWLKGLPTLRATEVISPPNIKTSVHKEPPGPNRWRNRSRTFIGVAAAMAEQWG